MKHLIAWPLYIFGGMLFIGAANHESSSDSAYYIPGVMIGIAMLIHWRFWLIAFLTYKVLKRLDR